MPNQSPFQKSLLIFCMTASALAAENAPSPLSLDWVLAQVRQNNPAIQAAQAEVGMAKSMAIAARAWPDPQVGVEFWDIPRPGFDLGASGQRLLDISQEIPFPAKTLLESQAASHAANLKQAEAETTAQAQLFMAKQAYWDLFTAVASLKALSKTARALDQLAGLSDRRNRFGQAGRMGQLMDSMAKMERVGLKNQAVALAQERLAAQNRLRRLMAAGAAQDLPDPAAGEAPFKAGLDEAALLKGALQNRPELMQARHHLWHTQAQRSLAAAGWMPDLMLQYSLVEASDGAQSAMGMAKLNLPFVWFWRQGAEQAAASKGVEASQAMLQSTLDETSEALKSELAMFNAARAQWQLQEGEALPEAENALKLGISGYQSGSLGVADALGALRAYLMANLEALGLKAQMGRSVAVLEQLSGARLGAMPSTEMNHENP